MSIYISSKGLSIFLREDKWLWQFPPELGWLFPLHKSAAFLLGLREYQIHLFYFKRKKYIIKGLLNNLTSGKNEISPNPIRENQRLYKCFCQQIHINWIKVVLPSNCHIFLLELGRSGIWIYWKKTKRVAVWPDRLHMGKYTTELHF